MPVPEEELKEWIRNSGKASHLVVMRDKEEGGYYPVYIMPGENLNERLKYLRLSANMQEVKDIIRLK